MLVGFYVIGTKSDPVALEYFFIDPRRIGQGYGKLLWRRLIQDCRQRGIKAFEIVTSPQAADFYLKMGARLCGEVESTVRRGRMIPQLLHTVYEEGGINTDAMAPNDVSTVKIDNKYEKTALHTG